jgi:hypothetical protein
MDFTYDEAQQAVADLAEQILTDRLDTERLLDLEAAATEATANEDDVGVLLISSLMEDALAVLDG